MKTLIQILIAIFLLLLITVLGLYLYENFVQKQPDKTSETTGVIDQTLNYANYTRASKFTAIISTLSLLKPQVSMAYMENGRWPEQLEDIGLSEADLVDEKYIDRIVLKDGKIYADASAEFGQGATVILRPKESMGGATIKWICQTNIALNQVNYCSYDRNLVYPL